MVVDGQTDFLELLLGGKTADNHLSSDGELQFFVPRERDTFDQQLDIEITDEIQIDDFLTDLSTKFSDDTGMPQTTLIIEDNIDPNLSAQVPTSSSTESSYDDSNVFLFDFQDNQHQRTLSESTDADSVYSYLDCSTPFSPTSPYSLPPTTPESASSQGASAKDLIKASLKMKLKNKRRMEGKEDIKIEFVAPLPEKLSEEELEQRRLKREKNKLAAQKCRGKKRERADVLEAQTKVLLAEQEESKMEIQKLIDERDRLMDIITIHGSVCPAMSAAYSAL